jgi:hypothetical protein
MPGMSATSHFVCVMLLERGEGPARIKTKMLRHGGAPLVTVEHRLRFHVLAARPISSAQRPTLAKPVLANFLG